MCQECIAPECVQDLLPGHHRPAFLTSRLRRSNSVAVRASCLVPTEATRRSRSTSKSPRTMACGAPAGTAGAPGDSFDSGEQFHELHGLDQVVIGSGPEAQHHTPFVVACGQDQDGGDLCDLAQFAQDVQAIQVRKAEVQQDHFVLPVGQECVLAAGYPGVLVAGGGDGCTQGRRMASSSSTMSTCTVRVLWLAGLVRGFGSWVGSRVLVRGLWIAVLVRY